MKTGRRNLVKTTHKTVMNTANHNSWVLISVFASALHSPRLISYTFPMTTNAQVDYIRVSPDESNWSE